MVMPARASCDLLERAAETAAVAELLASVGAGSAGCLILEGPAGIGKTSILDHARSAADPSGIEVRLAVGDDLESALPFGMARRLFEDVDPQSLCGGAELALPALTPGALSDTEAGSDVFPLLHGLFSLLRVLAEERPQLLLLDDLQWSDPQTLRFLVYLLNRLDRLPVALVLANRAGSWAAGDTAALLARLHSHPTSRVLRLSGLRPDSVATLVRRRLPVASDAFCRAVSETTTGNPFLCEELLSTAVAERIEPSDEGTVRLATLRHSGIHKALLVRLGQLGHDTPPVVAAVAVLGPSATVDRITAVSDLPRDRVADAVDRLVSSAILAPRGPVLQFVHPVIRETVYDDLGPGRRAASHRKVAALLLHEGSDPSEVAVHVLAAGGRPTVEMVPTLRAAASAAFRKGAPERAVELLETALTGDPGTQEPRVLVELARAEAACGRSTAIGRFRAALHALTTSEEDAAVARDIGSALYAAGAYDEAHGAFERGLDVLAQSPPTPARDLVEAQLVAGLDMTAMLLGSVAALPDGPTAMAADNGLPARARSCLAAGRHAFGVQVPVGHRTAAQTLAHARHALEGPPLPLELGTIVLEPLLLGLCIAGDVDRAHDELDRLAGLAVDRGDMPAYTSLVTVRALTHLEAGDLARAAADASEAVALSSELPGTGGQIDAAARDVLVRASLLSGDTATAERAIAVECAEERWGQSVLFGWYLDALGRVELHHGRAGPALDAFHAAGRSFLASTGPGAFCPWRSGASLAADMAGDRDQALMLADEELVLAEEYGARAPLARALRTRARLDDGAAAVARLQAAEGVLGGGPPLDLALLALDLGAALRRTGRRAEARDRLRQSLTLAQQCGASAVAALALDELRVAGARRSGTAAWGVDSLTPAERRVADLAADGLSNRQIAAALFVSRKTVEVHLSACYRKLGIGSRGELAAALG